MSAKIAILGDTHFGCHNSSIIHHEYMEKFYTDFFQYLDANDIHTIIQLGDLFDVRKHINTWSLNFFRNVFLSKIIERGIHVYVILGNHDIYYRESLQISSVEEILHDYSEWFTVVKEANDYIIEDQSFLLVPWICKENERQILEKVNLSKSIYCAGHFEFNGFELFRGHLAKSVHTHVTYKKFKQVFSGHYHHMSSKDNVLYTGTPYELTWQDCNTTKGFFVLSDDSIDLVENKHTLYSSIIMKDIDSIDKQKIHKKFVRVKLDFDLDVKSRESLLDNLYSMQPLDLKLIERSLIDNIIKEEENDKDVDRYDVTSNVTDMIGEYVNNVSLADTLDRDTLKNVLLRIYSEANSSAG
jgi:DNA repair exonuclease SbcCD nuclease subunit